MLKTDVLNLHAGFFKDYGFILNQSQFIFEKIFPVGKQVIFIHFVESPEGSYLEYHLGIRINEIEELVYQYLPTMRNHAEQSITLDQTMDKLGHAYPKKIKIEEVKELQKVIPFIEKFFLETGFSWLDKMIDPCELEQEFIQRNEIPFEDCNMVEFAFRSTALSKMYKTNDYPKVRQSFLEKIKCLDLTPFIIASYLQFLNYLDKLKLEAA